MPEPGLPITKDTRRTGGETRGVRGLMSRISKVLKDIALRKAQDVFRVPITKDFTRVINESAGELVRLHNGRRVFPDLHGRDIDIEIHTGALIDKLSEIQREASHRIFVPKTEQSVHVRKDTYPEFLTLPVKRRTVHKRKVYPRWGDL